jgi:hypothetical protein
MIYFPETIYTMITMLPWIFTLSSWSYACELTLCKLAFWSNDAMKQWNNDLPRLPSISSFYHIFPPPLSGFNWRSLSPFGGPGPFTSKMVPLSTGSTHTPLQGFRTEGFRQLMPASYTVVKAGGIFLFPRIFPSYFMKILQQIFRKNFLRSISWNFSKSNSNFSELPHSMIHDEKFRDLSGRWSADIVVAFLFHSPVAMRLNLYAVGHRI